MWRLGVSAEAELEIFEAMLRYERERAGLGFRFETQPMLSLRESSSIHSHSQ